MRTLQSVKQGFGVLENGATLQTAVMYLESGEESGPLANEHAGSEQVLLVFEGTIEAEIAGEKFQMMAGDTAIVPKDAPHRFTNHAQERAITFNVYSPKAY